jgi:hypothetical protein
VACHLRSGPGAVATIRPGARAAVEVPSNAG